MQGIYSENLIPGEGLMSNPSSADIYGFTSNQNLRAVLNSGTFQGNLLRSNTAAKIEEYLTAEKIPAQGRGVVESSYNAIEARRLLS
jgi:hypothetical protein